MLSASAAVVAPLRPVLGVWLSLDWGPDWGTLSREFEAMAALAADASAEGCAGSALMVFSASTASGRGGARGAKGEGRDGERDGKERRARAEREVPGASSCRVWGGGPRAWLGETDVRS